MSSSTGAPDCLDELEFTLFIVILGRMSSANAVEILYPIIMAKLKVWRERKSNAGDTSNLSGAQRKKAPKLADTDKYEQSEYEAKLNMYGDLQFFDDYNELVLLYGYVVLFAVAFPLAPLMAFLNNVAEVHV